MFRVSSTGQWTPTSPATIATGRLPESLVVDPSGRFVYVANARDSTVSQFLIDPASGLLTPMQPATVVTGAFPQDIAIDPTGRSVLTANSNDGTVSVLLADSVTGALTPGSPAAVPASDIPDPSNIDPTGLAIDPLGRFAYSINNDNSYGFYAFNAASSTLKITGVSHAGCDGRCFPGAIDPAGKFLYVPQEGANSLKYFAIGQTDGSLPAEATGFVDVGQAPSSVAIDPTGRFLYVINRNDQTISQFARNPDGSLTPLATPLISDPGQPWQILIDPSGQLAYVSNEATSAVTIFRIGTDGQLTPYSSAPAGPGAGGMGIAIPQQTTMNSSALAAR